MRKRGGYVKNIKVKDCILEDIRIWSGENAMMTETLRGI